MTGATLPAAASRRALTAALLAISLAGCEETFVPIAATDLQFSIYGYLDAAADTQWVRVMPIRPTILTSPDPLGVTVAIQDVESGRVIELRDSVFRFSPFPDIGSEGTYIHNYWAAERLDPGAAYRLTVSQPDLVPAVAEVVLPPVYDAEMLISNGRFGRSGMVAVNGASHLAFAILSTWYYDLCSARSQRNFLNEGEDGLQDRLVGIVYDIEAEPGCGAPVVERQEVFLVASGSPWPRGEDYDPRLLGVPDLPSNISNALGFVGGVMTRTLPYEDCILQPLGSDPCRLTYGPETAAIEGLVHDALCTKAGLPRTLVELLELGPPDPEGRKLRPTYSYRSGRYRIAGLEPGRAYELRASRPPATEAVNRYEVHTDTLTFSPGQLLAYDVPLRREECPDL